MSNFNKSTFFIASLLALVCHAALLLVNYSIKTHEDNKPFIVDVFIEKEVSETPSEKDASLEEKDPVIVEESVQPLDTKPSIASASEVITKSSEPSKKNESSESIPLSDLNSFIVNDAKSFVSNNPDKMDALSETFKYKPNIPVYEPTNIDEARNQASQQGGGRRILENGRHVCFAIIQDLSSANTGSYTVAGDCTPKQKFILDMNAPNNG